MISRRSVIFVSFWVLSLGWQGCSHHALDEAQRVVAEADSLWHEGKMYGIDAGDSLSLAQAYETLGKYSAYYAFVHRTSLLATYAHACYHYGRLLRKKDDPVAAMQVFINATHSRTDDLHILGRIYSNMGSLCHLAGEYPLSYDMYEKSADLFKLNGDTLNYYYALNDMAIEQAEMKDSAKTNLLLDSIKTSDNRDFYITVQETKALLYQSLKKYDSVLVVINNLESQGYLNFYGKMLKARAFSYLHQSDSALRYARELLTQTQEESYLIDLYYILTQDDNGLPSDTLRILTSKRIDIQKEWTKSRNKLAQAIQVLKQDKENNRNDRIKYVIGFSVFSIVIMCISLIYVHRKRKTIAIGQARQKVQQKQIQTQRANYQQKLQTDLEITCSALRKSTNLKKELVWGDYERMCVVVNSRLNGVADKLSKYEGITSNDIRLCILVLINLSYDDIANMLNLSPKSIAKLKSITAHKLGATMKNLREKLIKIICQADLQ